MPLLRHRHALLTLLFGALSCIGTARAQAPAAIEQARQLVLVVSADWNAAAGHLQTFEKKKGQWVAVQNDFPVSLGRAGSAWGMGLHPPQSKGPLKEEGDGRSPAGIFAIGPAFGYAASLKTALPYQPMQATSYCMDVPASPLYNQIVDSAKVGAAAVQGSTEPMRLDLRDAGDIRYRQGFVIAHNAGAVPGRGSCIFAHLRRKPDEATAGCTSMEAANMDQLLGWLNPARKPVFVLLPREEYMRLQGPWQLPELPGAHG
jgi:L,D-peptidoglycan transpeptidase YkuD (ErfK/YbiS/YcfS/YnhG family)